jgi:hypothetical protein
MVEWVVPGRVVEHLACWKGWFGWNNFNCLACNPFLFNVVHLERKECLKFRRLREEFGATTAFS